MRDKRGIAMVVVMMALGLLAVTVLAISFLSNRSLMQSKLQGETDEAFFAAQAALSLKVAELNSGDDTPKNGKMTDSDAHYDAQVYPAGSVVPEVPGLGIPVDHFYIVAKGYDRDPAAAGPSPREVAFGALFKQSATVFTGAALAGNSLSVTGNAQTDTFNSATGLAGDHALAHVGVFKAGGNVNVGASSYIGYNGAAALADILVPTGHSGSVSAGASNYASLTMNPFLTDPDPVPSRAAGSTDLVVSSSTTITPTLVGGEYVVKAKDMKVENAGTVLTLDVSSVPDGETVYMDVNEFNMDKGVFEVLDTDSASYGTGTASEVSVQVYAVSKFDVVNGGQFRTINDEPSRMVAYTEGPMHLQNMATSYMVGRSKTTVLVSGNSEVFGSILGENSVEIKASSKVHYDENLTNAGTGATGSGTLQFVSFQSL
jgi:hypothetical protein